MIEYEEARTPNYDRVTNRSRIAKFTGLDGEQCEIGAYTDQDCRTMYVIREENDDDGGKRSGGIIISQALAAEIIPILQRFVNTGEV